MSSVKPVDNAHLETPAPAVRTPEACVRALYALISGPAEEPRDWVQFRMLCRPDARFVLATYGADGEAVTMAYDLEQFITEGTREFATRGLWERELVGRVERFGRVAHVFSSYESRVDRVDAPVVARGVNSVQCVKEPDGAWRIAQLTWDRETPDQPLPADLDEPTGE